MRLRGFAFQLCASTAAVGIFLLVEREVVRKMADEVAVYADLAGFRELAAEHPWGAVDWLLRLVAATNLTWWGGVIHLALVAGAGTLAFFALRRLRMPFAPFAPWLAAALFTVPTLALGDRVWFLRYPHFPQLHLALFAILAVCFLARWKGLVGFVVLQLSLVLVGRMLFADLSPVETLRSAWGVPPAFGGRSFDLCDCRDQLRMERAALEGRFGDILDIAPDKRHPARMETAWRILAMFRTDRLDRDLYRYPIAVSLPETRDPEMIMEGPLLLFHYGLVLPARRWIFDTAAFRGWQPQHYRLLGDIALVTREFALARKYFATYARFPFRGDFAARRLRELEDGDVRDATFADLAPVVGMYGVWRDFESRAGGPVYIEHDNNAERFAYSQFLKLQDCPPEMAKMFFAVALLGGCPELLRENEEALRALYPDGRIGPVFQEALK